MLRLSLAFLCFSAWLIQSAWCDEVLVVSGSEQGQGITLMNGGTCYVITAGHLIKNASADISLRTRDGVIGSAQYERSYGSSDSDQVDGPKIAELALLRVTTGSLDVCKEPHWPDRGSVENLVRTGGTAVIRSVNESTDLESLLTVQITTDDDRYLTVIPSNTGSPAEQRGIVRTWSGSPVYVGTEVVGLLVGVDDQGNGKVYRREYVNNQLTTFFQQGLVPALVAAVRSGDASAAKKLLDQGADPLSPVGDGIHNIVTLAASLGKESILMEIVSRPSNGTAMNTPDQSGCTALGWALQEHQEPIVELAAAHGADPNLLCPGNNPKSAVASAIRANYERTVRALVQLGVEPDREILEFALQQSSAATVRALIDGNAFRNAPETIFVNAAERPNILQLLKTAGLIQDDTKSLCQVWSQRYQELDLVRVEKLVNGGITCSGEALALRNDAEDHQRYAMDHLIDLLDIDDAHEESGFSNIPDDIYSYSAEVIDQCQIRIKEIARTQGDPTATNTITVHLDRIDLDGLDIGDIVSGLPGEKQVNVRRSTQSHQAILREGNELEEFTIHAGSKEHAKELAAQLQETGKGCLLLEHRFDSVSSQ